MRSHEMVRVMIKRTITMNRGDTVTQGMFHACRANYSEPTGMVTSTSKNHASGEIDCDSNWPEHAARERRTLERVSNGEM